MSSGTNWKDRATRAARALSDRVTKGAREQAEKAQEAAQKLAVALGGVARDADSSAATLARFVEGLSAVRSHLDREATAVALGTLTGGGAGVAYLFGTELFYLRPDGPLQGHLRVNQINGREAHLAAGASSGAYAACFYGPREALARPMRRRGADVGIIVASLAFVRLDAPGTDKRAGGWMLGLSLGVGLGIPLLSSISALELHETPLAGHKLGRAEAEKLERILGEAPDRPWRRRIAAAL